MVRTCIALLLALVLSSHSTFVSASRGKIGVDYGLNGNNLLTPAQTVKLLHSKGVKRVRTYESRPDVTQAFANKKIDLMIGVTNEEVPKLAASLGEAFTWVTKNVVPFPTSGISAIMVGNEWLSNSSNDPSVLVPAMQNIYNALSTLKLSGIHVSTSHSFDVLKNPSYPPSIATFADRFVAVMRALLDFLESTGSFFMVNIFPYFAYLADEGVSREFALFESTSVNTDPNTGLNYTNLFDMQLDAVYAAIAFLSSSSSSPSSKNASSVHVLHTEATNRNRPAARKRPPRPQVKVRVGETGWSSGGGSSNTPGSSTQSLPSSHSLSALSSTIWASPLSSNAPYVSKAQEDARCACDVATMENAHTYNQNLIRHVLQAKGTPANPKTPIRAYVFAVFNEDLKPAGTERYYGLFFPNGTAVYPISFKRPLV